MTYFYYDPKKNIGDVIFIQLYWSKFEADETLKKCSGLIIEEKREKLMCEKKF